jgi:hypothetical protein
VSFEEPDITIESLKKEIKKQQLSIEGLKNKAKTLDNLIAEASDTSKLGSYYKRMQEDLVKLQHQADVHSFDKLYDEKKQEIVDKFLTEIKDNIITEKDKASKFFKKVSELSKKHIN